MLTHQKLLLIEEVDSGAGQLEFDTDIYLQEYEFLLQLNGSCVDGDEEEQDKYMFLVPLEPTTWETEESLATIVPHLLDRYHLTFKLLEQIPEPLRSSITSRQPFPGQKEYKCELCTIWFLVPEIFHQHMWMHANLIPCTCKFCGAPFQVQKQLTDHILKVHSDLLKCYTCICQDRFESKQEFDEHKIDCQAMQNTLIQPDRHTITPAVKFDPLLCQQCETSFKNRALLAEHVRGHMQDVPYKCKICRKVFTKKTQYSTFLCHILTHKQKHRKPMELKT